MRTQKSTDPNFDFGPLEVDAPLLPKKNERSFLEILRDVLIVLAITWWFTDKILLALNRMLRHL